MNQQQRFCTACGHPVDGMRFCTNCGAPVPATPTSPTAPTAPSGPVGPPPAPPTQTAPEPVASSRTPSSMPTVGWSPTQSVHGAAPQQMPPTSAHQPGRPRRNGPGTAVWVLLGVALVLLVGGGAFALGAVANRGDDTHGVTPPARATAGGPTAHSSSPETTSSKSIDPDSAEGLARSISALMADSRMDKSEIGGASSDLGACRNVPAGIRTFDDAASSRHRLVVEAGKLDVGGLPGGQTVVDELTQAWTVAGQADEAYARWGRSVHRVHGRCVGDNGALKQATDLSARSHPHKQAAAKAWNPIARKYGLPTVQWDQL